MTRRFFSLWAGLLAMCGPLHAETTNATPDFKEVYQLLRANLPGVTDESLNRAAVAGLLAQFPGRVLLAGGAADEPATNTILIKAFVLEGNVAYLRAGNVGENFAGGVVAACRALAVTNKVAGVVLDLRFAGGSDFASVRAGAESIKAVASPLMVLVNGGTSGAAEALAAALRDAGAGLLIGSATSGGSSVFKELPLQNGGRLEIATASGKPAVSVQPDIAVTVGAEDERTFWDNPYGIPPPGGNLAGPGTNVFSPFIDHLSEADLVRSRRNGDRTNDVEPAPRASEPPAPVIRDPALARAVDLIKGLAAVRPPRP